MKLSKAIAVCLLVAVMDTVTSAQQPDGMVTLGGLRVPPCAVSSDPDYGHTREKPIQLGGGPAYAAARMSRYIGALRGPQGQTVQLSTRVGSFSAPLGYWDETTILDSYTVSYDGQSMPLYVDTYHFSLPEAPSGFTCGGPLVAMLGLPPLDPLRTNANILAHGIEQGTAHEISPIPLDFAVPRGDFLDQFTMIALLARAAAVSGAPLDPNKPAPGMAPAVFNVLTYPVACGDRMINPQAIEMATSQGPLPRNGDFIRGDEALKASFPGLMIPAGSLAARFRHRRCS